MLQVRASTYFLVINALAYWKELLHMRQSRQPCLVPSVFRLLYNYANRDRFARLLQKIPLFAVVKVSSICRSRARTRYRSNCKWISCDAFSLSAKRARVAVFIFDTCLVIFEWKFHYSSFFFHNTFWKARVSIALFLREKTEIYKRPLLPSEFLACVLCQRFEAWQRLISYHGNVAKWLSA